MSIPYSKRVFKSASVLTESSALKKRKLEQEQNEKAKEASNKRLIRAAGGQVWEDPTLEKEWDPNDFRIFCGDLAPETTTDALGAAFKKYSSFQHSKVITDKSSQRSKGYGFVSFKDPQDYLRALKEMNGKIVCGRPLKLRKSNWKDRNVK